MKRTEYRFNKPETKCNRKELRSFGTSAEAALWQMLKRRQIRGVLFRRQFSVGPFILDFYCPQIRLCIELDGQPHFTPEGEEHDIQRSEYLLRLFNIRVVRFENQAVYDYPESVLSEIETVVDELLSIP